MSFWHNPLANMNGPLFLVLYLVVIAVVIVVCKSRFVQTDDTLSRLQPLKVPQLADPYEIAFLRGGVNEVIRLGVFKLLKAGYLTTAPLANRKEKSTAQQVQINPVTPPLSDLSPLETDLCKYFEKPHTTAEMFADTRLISNISSRCTEYELKIKREQLVAPDTWKWERQKVILPGALIILVLCAYKLFAALTTGHENVGFMIVECFGGIIVLATVVKYPILTQRGIRYLADLKRAYGAMAMSRFTQDASIPEGTFQRFNMDATLLPIALLGIGALGSSGDASYGKLFNKAALNRTSTGSSPSCGGGGGGCGSGSCSGGGGGDGGGCGGCGGGG